MTRHTIRARERSPHGVMASAHKERHPKTPLDVVAPLTRHDMAKMGGALV